MFVFIDESGTHKKVGHSTFALAYVEADDIGLLERQITNIEKRLGIDYFHWSETVWRVKEKFMDEALKLDFKVKIAVFRNPVNPAQELEKVLTHLIVEKNIRNIYVDGKKPKWYARKIKKILRMKGTPVRKLKTVKSSQFAGIRLADMAAGLSRSYFDGKNLDKISVFYKRLEKKAIIVI